MPDNPVPLREALKETAQRLIAIASFGSDDEDEWERVYMRFDALIEQIPSDLEANDAE